MKQIIVFILTTVLIATSCKNNQETSTISTLEVYSDSLFQASIDSAQIAGAAILVYQNGKTIL